MTRRQSILSDDLLQHLIAVGQVDVLVGLPTLNHAPTAGHVASAVQEAFVRGFSRERAVLINSDGGSTDGTQEAVRRASAGGATLQATHTLRTIHRVVAPYHGLPGKRSAVRTIFSAAALLQPRAVVIVDPASPAPDPDVIVALISAVIRDGYDFAGLAPRRHPREAPLVSQLLRPVLAAAYGATFDDPLAEEYAVSDRFVADALAHDIWDDEGLRAGIDLRLHTLAHAGRYRPAELRVPPRPRSVHGPRPGLGETVQQLARALWTCLELDEAVWTAGDSPRVQVSSLGRAEDDPDPPGWDLTALDAAFRDSFHTLEPLLATIIGTHSMATLRQAAASPAPALTDDAWAQLVAECSAAWRARRKSVDHVTGAIVPLYLGRAASFLRETESLGPAALTARLDALTNVFVAARPALVRAWGATTPQG